MGTAGLLRLNSAFLSGMRTATAKSLLSNWLACLAFLDESRWNWVSTVGFSIELEPGKIAPNRASPQFSISKETRTRGRRTSLMPCELRPARPHRVRLGFATPNIPLPHDSGGHFYFIRYHQLGMNGKQRHSQMNMATARSGAFDFSSVLCPSPTKQSAEGKWLPTPWLH